MTNFEILFVVLNNVKPVSMVVKCEIYETLSFHVNEKKTLDEIKDAYKKFTLCELDLESEEEDADGLTVQDHIDEYMINADYEMSHVEVPYDSPHIEWNNQW